MASLGIHQLIYDLIYSIALVLGVILITLFLLLRNPKLTLLALLPNIIPLIFTLATLRLIGADLQTSNIVSFTVSVGLAVDDTIHFLYHFDHSYRAGGVVERALEESMKQAGKAILITSILLIGCLGIYLTAELASLRRFGFLMVLSVLFAVLADFLLTPILIRLVYRDHAPSTTD